MVESLRLPFLQMAKWGRGRWASLAATVAVATVAVAGSVIVQEPYSPPAGGGGTGGTVANLWIDTDGGTCTRNSTAASYSSASACGTIDAAYDAASCGDQVLVKSGTYSTGQTVTGTKSCSGWFTTSCSNCVTFSEPTGETATFSSASNDISADWIYWLGIDLNKVEFSTDANNIILDGISSTGFNIFGADYITLQNSTWDGGTVDTQNLIWDSPAGNYPDQIYINDNVFRNFYNGSNTADHAEAIYVGYSRNGMIDGNTFTNNGTTAHIFFTHFGNENNPSTSYPRNWCVKNNIFNETWTAYFSIDLRAEIDPTLSGIDVEATGGSSNVQNGSQGFISNTNFVRAC